MAGPIIFPSVDLVVTQYLRAALADYGHPALSVVNARTTTNPQVWVRRDGGPALDVVREAARVGVNVFAVKDFDADGLSRTVSALMREAAGVGPIVRVLQTMGPSPVADAVARRYMTFEVWVRGANLAPTP